MAADPSLNADAERDLARLWGLLEQAQALATGSDVMANMEQIRRLCDDAGAVARSLAVTDGDQA